MQPLISCIMPTRNRRAFALQAVRYFLRQDYAHVELIVVDDSAESLRAALPDDPRIRYTHSRKPLSIGRKRNMACEQARGEIIAHWDDDDWYALHRLSHQVAPLLDGRADISGLETACFLDVRGWKGWRLCSDLHARMFVAGVHGATLMYWRALWGSLSRFPDVSLGEDAVFLQKAVERGARVVAVPHAGSFVYLRHSRNTWRFEPGVHIDPRGWLPANPDDFIPPEDRGFYMNGECNQYKISVAAYLREQVKVFYHLACIGNWQHVFTEQLRQLQKNGFRSIDLTVLGAEDDLQRAEAICAESNVSSRIIFHASERTCFERPAMLAIESYARRNEGYVLYLHSKGVSNPADQTKTQWRQLMMRELVENWEHCLSQLPHYDLIGVNWRDMPPISHFSGNFWYASTRYLRSLADFQRYYDNPHYQIWDPVNDKRLGCEFWIGSSHEVPCVLSLVCRNVDFCDRAFWEHK